MAQFEEKSLDPKSVQALLSKLDKKTIGSIQGYLAAGSRLSGRDRTAAMAQIFGMVLNDSGAMAKVPARGEISDALGLFDLGVNWNKIDDVNKFTQTGRQVVDLANRYSGVTIPYAGNALSLANIGYSQSQLVNNWDKLDNTQRLIGLANTYTQIDQAYSLFEGAQAAYAGASSVAGGGSGATGAASAVSNFGSSLAAGAPMAGVIAGVAAAAWGAHSLISNFGEGGVAGRQNGAAAGTALGASFGPFGLAFGAALGTAIGSVKTGKSQEQQMRDSYRGVFENFGVFKKFSDVRGEGFNLINSEAGGLKGDSSLAQLANGSFYNVGIDGSGGRATFNGEQKRFSDPNRILVRDKDAVVEGDGLRPYDVDYTNDLDAFADLALKPLQHLLGRGTEQGGEFGQMFGYLTNAAVSNAGGREFTQGNFDTAMQNVRNFYAQAGINNSDQAHNLLTQLFNEGKISEGERDIALQGLEIGFNNNFSLANTLNETRWEGVEFVGAEQDFIMGGENIRNPIVQQVTEQEAKQFNSGLPGIKPIKPEVLPVSTDQTEPIAPITIDTNQKPLATPVLAEAFRPVSVDDVTLRSPATGGDNGSTT